MPVLDDPKREAFAVGVARGLTLAKAYIEAGYSPDGARQHAHRLMIRNPDVSLRVQELRIQISTQVIAGVVAREISDRNARLGELQARWDWLRHELQGIVEERGAALAGEVPGGGSGLLVKQWMRGNGEDHPVCRIDPGVLGLIRLLLEHEKRAAEEMGQWGRKPDNLDQQEEELDLDRLTDEELDLWSDLIEKAKPPEREPK